MKICYLYLDKAGAIDNVLAKYQSCVSETVWWRRHGVCSPGFFLLCLICPQRMLQTKGQVPVLTQAKYSLELRLPLSLVSIITPRLVLDVIFIVKPTLELQNTSAQCFSNTPCTEKLPISCCLMLSSSTVRYRWLGCSLCRVYDHGIGLILSLFLSHGSSRALLVSAHLCCPSWSARVSQQRGKWVIPSSAAT